MVDQQVLATPTIEAERKPAVANPTAMPAHLNRSLPAVNKSCSTLSELLLMATPTTTRVSTRAVGSWPMLLLPTSKLCRRRGSRTSSMRSIGSSRCRVRACTLLLSSIRTTIGMPNRSTLRSPSSLFSLFIRNRRIQRRRRPRNLPKRTHKKKKMTSLNGSPSGGRTFRLASALLTGRPRRSLQHKASAPHPRKNFHRSSSN